MDTDGHGFNNKNTNFYMIYEKYQIHADEIKSSVLFCVYLWIFFAVES